LKKISLWQKTVAAMAFTVTAGFMIVAPSASAVPNKADGKAKEQSIVITDRTIGSVPHAQPAVPEKFQELVSSGLPVK
jgi:SNF family Na+-dependent transporter